MRDLDQSAASPGKRAPFPLSPTGNALGKSIAQPGNTALTKPLENGAVRRPGHDRIMTINRRFAGDLTISESQMAIVRRFEYVKTDSRANPDESKSGHHSADTPAKHDKGTIKSNTVLDGSTLKKSGRDEERQHEKTQDKTVTDLALDELAQEEEESKEDKGAIDDKNNSLPEEKATPDDERKPSRVEKLLEKLDNLFVNPIQDNIVNPINERFKKHVEEPFNRRVLQPILKPVWNKVIKPIGKAIGALGKVVALIALGVGKVIAEALKLVAEVGRIMYNATFGQAFPSTSMEQKKPWENWFAKKKDKEKDDKPGENKAKSADASGATHNKAEADHHALQLAQEAAQRNSPLTPG